MDCIYTGLFSKVLYNGPGIHQHTHTDVGRATILVVCTGLSILILPDYN